MEIGITINLAYVLMFFTGLFSWYVLYGLECFLNGAIANNQITMPFVCFVDDFMMNLPLEFSKKKRIQFAKRLIGEKGRGSTSGKTKTWNDEEVRKGNLYAEYLDDVMPSKKSFWITNTIYFLIGWAFMGGTLKIVSFISSFFNS